LVEFISQNIIKKGPKYEKINTTRYKFWKIVEGSSYRIRKKEKRIAAEQSSTRATDSGSF
jgi:hypothetical protein